MRTVTSNPTSFLLGQMLSEPMDRHWRVYCCPGRNGQHAWVSRRWRHRLPARLDWWWHRTTHHPFLQRHSQRVRLLWLLVAAVVAGAVFLVWTAEPAAAHRAEFSVSVTCQQDGRWTASWALENSESRKVMDIEQEDVTDLTPNPTPYSGTSRDTTTHANTVASVTAHVRVDWIQNPGATVSATAHRPEACQTPTTVPPTTSTTEPGAVLIPPLVVERPAPAVPFSAEVTFTG